LNRRAFLLLAAGAAVGAAAAWRLLDDGGSPNEVVAALFDDLGAARNVGGAYLDSHPGEAGEERLTSVLGLDDSAPPYVQGERLRAEVRRDYAESRLVLVEGWYLSITEARLCALSTYG
jgi:hypothetical protein